MTHLERLPRLAFLLSLGLLLAVTTSAVDQQPAPSAAPLTRESLAEAIRTCDPPLARTSFESPSVIRGLAAWACGESQRAYELLSVGSTDGYWEDWRLLTLAQSAAELARSQATPPGQEEEDIHGESPSDPKRAAYLTTASIAVEALLASDQSPLRDLAYPLGVSIERSAGDHERALALVGESRGRVVDVEIRTELDVMGWEIARELGRTADIQAAARRLLLHSPLEAIDLDVEPVLEGAGQEILWADQFVPAELLLRATNLVSADLPEIALQTLAAVATEQRSFDWHLLEARALIDARRGVEALESLATVGAPDRASMVDLEWHRAEAALDAATARRGRANLPAAQRTQMRQRAHEHLWHVARQGGDSVDAVDALRLLFEELADGEHFEQVRSILETLRELDARDTSGVRYLWQLGWSEYRQRNFSGAIGYWSELAKIYSETQRARAGRYWSARSHQKLGNGARSRTLYELLASSPSADYYSKLALERLGRGDRQAQRLEGSLTTEWPSDPILLRAQELSDLGLDTLALTEIEQLATAADERAQQALRSRILARQGHRRDSIQHLWRVFPVLGGAFQDEAPPEALRMYYPLDFLEVVRRFAADNQLPVPLLLAMIRQESAFDVSARSWAGARGLMQVMPATARELAERMGLRYSSERLNEPIFSIRLGSRYFRQVLDMFDGNLELALAGYNAGPYRIRRMVRSAGPDLEIDSFLEGLRFEESKTYVKRVTLFSDSYQRLYPELG